MADSQAAILTKPQREYLRGEREPTQERTMRTRIRERIRAGLGDIALLTETLPGTDDWDLIFEDLETWVEYDRQLAERDEGTGRKLHGRANPDELEEGRLMTRHLHGVAVFLYFALAKLTGEIEIFENVIATAIELVETTPTERASVTVNVTIERTPRPTELIEKFERGDPLTEEEYETLLETGELDTMELLKREGIIADPGDEE